MESRYNKFVRSNPKFANRECIAWHGTSTECHNGSCKSFHCALCHIIRQGFRKDRARRNIRSYSQLGQTTYFSNKSFVSHTYNGGSQNMEYERCTIMSKINYGHTLHLKKIEHAEYSSYVIPTLIKNLKYDSADIHQDRYIAPADYILLYNDAAALPTYIIVYSARRKLQVRNEEGGYCARHGENHIVNDEVCCAKENEPLHWDSGCKRNEYESDNMTDFSKNDDSDDHDYMKIKYSEADYMHILKNLGSTVYP